MREHEADLTALKREWLAARVVLIVGFILAMGFGIYTAYLWRMGIVNARQQAAAEVAAQQATGNAQTADAQAGALVCRQALANAQNFGIVPSFTKLTNDQPQRTNVTGRYACAAATDSSQFALVADLICKDLNNPRCVPLYSVTQNGGAMLYQRHD